MTEFRILGPLDVRENGHAIDVGGGKQRALLAVLLLRSGETVSTDLLLDALWGDRPPESAPGSMHAYVSRLRKALGRERVAREPHGYRLVVDPEELDLTRFQTLLDTGRDRLAGGDAEAAAEILREALSLWRGPPLADFTYEPFAAEWIARLEEMRLEALEERIEADLALERHRQLVPQLDALVREHPLRERLRGQQMLALYRSGRQAEALEAYGDVRSLLVAELGLEPGPQLQELQRRILRHDPVLDAPVSARPRGARRFSRQPILIAAVALLTLASVAVALALTRSDGAATVVAGPNTVGVIDTGSNRLDARIPVGIHPVGIAYRGGEVWVANTNSNTVSSIDPKTRRVTTIGIDSPPTDVVFAGENVWTGNGSAGSLSVISPALGKVVGGIDLSGGQSLIRNSVNALAGGAGSLWAAMASGEVVRVDARTRRIVKSVHLGSPALAIAYGAGAAWAMTANDHLFRIGPRDSKISGDQLVGYPIANSLTVSGAHVLAGVQPSLSKQAVEMLDAESMQPEWSTVMGYPAAIAVGRDAIWVASGTDRKVYRLDPASGKAIRAIPVGGIPVGLAVVGDEVWVTIDRFDRPD